MLNEQALIGWSFAVNGPSSHRYVNYRVDGFDNVQQVHDAVMRLRSQAVEANTHVSTEAAKRIQHYSFVEAVRKHEVSTTSKVTDLKKKLVETTAKINTLTLQLSAEKKESAAHQKDLQLARAKLMTMTNAARANKNTTSTNAHAHGNAGSNDKDKDKKKKTTAKAEGPSTSTSTSKSTSSAGKTNADSDTDDDDDVVAAADDKSLCIICFERPINVVFIPCGHFGACFTCGHVLKQCPFCRQLIRSFVKTFSVTDSL